MRRAGEGRRRQPHAAGHQTTIDADQIVAECRDLIAQHGIDAQMARNVVVKAMLGDQPLPLKGERVESST